jgi:hypothetical protein
MIHNYNFIIFNLLYYFILYFYDEYIGNFNNYKKIIYLFNSNIYLNI